MEYRRLYIAYGSNINLEQMANRCPNSKVIGKEMLKGYELVQRRCYHCAERKRRSSCSNLGDRRTR